MIITNLIDKIKGKIVKEGESIIYIIIIILVGVSSFFLGKMSYSSSVKEKNIESYSIMDINKENKGSVIKEKNYFASKNGKIFYKANCPILSRIKEENLIWFETRDQAIESGFSASASSCNN